MELLKRNWISLVLGLVVIYFVWDKLTYHPDTEMYYKAAERSFKVYDKKLNDSLKVLNGKIEVMKIKSDSVDSAINKDKKKLNEKNINYTRVQLDSIRTFRRTGHHLHS